MKIAYNPKTAAVITAATAANDDILFDLNARKVWAKGLRMGADWADISSKPSSLKNPAALTTFGVVYDGSVAKTVTTSTFISLVNEDTNTVTDGTMLITSYASNNGFSHAGAVNIPYKRKASHLWDYIKTKTDALYSAIEHNHDDRYLKLTGGTMAGNALITFADSGSWNANKEPQGARGGLYWSGQSDYAKLYAEETASDNLDLVIQFGDDNSNGLSIRNKSGVQTSYISSSGIITTRTFEGNLDWSYITNKPDTFTPSAHEHTYILDIGNNKHTTFAYSKDDLTAQATDRLAAWNGYELRSIHKNLLASMHTHAWNSLTHSSTTENQAILTNGKANGWKLLTLNIVNWDTAYNFVSTITGTDTDNVINKWDEIVNFLAGITEDNKLNTLLNSKLSVYKLADKTNVGAIKNNGIYYSTTDASSSTLTNSPFNNGFTLINMTSYDEGDDLRRSRLAFNAYGEIKVSDDRDLANTAETWYNVLTSKNTYISNGKGIINGITITQVDNATNADTTDGVHIKWAGALTSTNHLVAWEADGSALRDINPANVTVGNSNYAASSGYAHGVVSKGILNSQEMIDNFITENKFEYAIFKTTESNNVGFVSNDGMILSIPWNSTEFGAQIAFDDVSQGTVKVRGKRRNWGNWYTLLHSGNYNSYSPTLTGTGASGTWDINITGNADSASKLQTARRIWGLGFDGTSDVNGSLSGTGNITPSSADAFNIGSNSLGYKYGYFQWLGAKSGQKLELGANNSNFGLGLCLDTNLNVGIGTNTPAYKLLVMGNVYAASTVTSAGFIHSGVTKNANLYVLTADGGYTFLNLASNELAHEFSKNITVTSEWTDIEDFYGGNLSFLTLPGTYIVLVYYKDASADGMYEGYFSGIMSWYTGKTNSNNADEIVLHRVGHAYANTIYLRTRESLSSEANPYTKLQISANSDLKQHTYKFKFKRIC